MGEKIGIGIGTNKSFGVVIEKKGLFNFNKLYSLIKKWYTSYKYNWNEKEFSCKVKSGKNEFTIEYSGFREVTPYIKFNVNILIEIKKVKELKIKTNKNLRGHIKAYFKAYYEKDYKNKWKFFPFLRKIYEEYFIKQEILKYEGKLWVEANKLITNIKKALDLMQRK